MAKIILINPDYYNDIFAESKVKAAISRGTPPLCLLTIAAPLIKSGHTVEIINLNVMYDRAFNLAEYIQTSRPDIVGVTSTTPMIYKAYKLAEIVKSVDNTITLICGGPHVSALPEQVLKESLFDIAAAGEGDFVLRDIAENGLSDQIPNIYFKHNNKIVHSVLQQNTVNDLDQLPYPAYELLDINRYFQPGLSSRKQPVAYIETSRGCYAKCIYCNKNIFGRRVRQKSPIRVVDEMEYLLKLGFGEIHIIDDIFTANKIRATAICNEIIQRNLHFPWYPRGGLRVNNVSYELLCLMKKAGCYRIPFGIESGSQRIIDRINKQINLSQAVRAVKWAQQAGLETETYFMAGLPGETEADLRATIDFAIQLNPDYAKYAVSIPLPGTEMFYSMDSNGQILTKKWDKYTFSSSPRQIYRHDTLPWEIIDKYVELFYRKFYFRPAFIFKTLIRTIRAGTFLEHLKGFFKTKW